MADPKRPYRISVIGAAQATSEEEALAEALGQALGQPGAVVITGGLGGVMEAACRGCVRGGGLTVGVLPGTDPAACNPWVMLPLATGMGEARNALVVRYGEAVIAVGGGWGTLSEIALARKMGRKVVVLAPPSVEVALPRAESPEEGAAWALQEVERRRGVDRPPSVTSGDP